MREGDRIGERFLLEEGPLHRSTDEASEVWLAYDERMGRAVVLKRSAAEPVAESRAMAKFNHQHVITLYEYLSVHGDGADAGNWLVMEYAPRGSLAGTSTMDPQAAARIGAQIASALVDLHAKGIVHCDIKPANIVIAENGAAKLTDFGAAYRVDDEETLTPETPISYTPAYAAPEVVRGSPVRTSDVYSLAATVFALVAGHSPHVPGKQDPDLGPLTDVLSAMRGRKPADRPDAASAQRMFEDVAAGIEPAAHSTADAAVVPAQLPGDVYGFAGRTDELDRLDRLVARAADEQPTAVVISAISGMAGVGKTALAVHWAHRNADRFADGQLYVNLRGFEPSGLDPLDPSVALRGFLEALGTPPERVPADLDDRTALYRSLLVGKHVLVVLDDARDTNQVRPLLPGTPGCLVLVTSRGDLTGLVTREGAHPLVLDLLTSTEAGQLLERRLGHDRLAAEPDAVDDIIAACARLPLALAIVAARAAIRPDLPLTALVAELQDNKVRLDALATEGPDTDVRAVFSWSYQQLTSEAGRLFRLLGPHPGPDISAPAAASLAGIELPRANRLLAELARAHVVGEHLPGRYALHDLLRTYANELTHTMDSDAERHAARQRLFDHFVHTAHPAAVLFNPAQDPVDLEPPATGVVIETIGDERQAMTWFGDEHHVLLAAIDDAAVEFDTHVWQLAWAMANYLDRLGRWQDRVEVWSAGLAAAERLGDRVVQARAHRNLANGNIKLRRLDQARANLEQAFGRYAQLGDYGGQAHTQRLIAFLYEQQGRHDEALQRAQHALELYETVDHRGGVANVHNDIGWYQAQLGRYDQTIASCKQALTLLEQLGDRTPMAATWDTIGFAHHQLGDHQEAIACYQEALELLAPLDQRDDHAAILDHLGDAQEAAGDRAAARASWQHALSIFEELEHDGDEELRAKLAAL